MRPKVLAVFMLITSSNFVGGGLRALQNLVHKGRRAPVNLPQVCPIRHEAAEFGKLTKRGDCGYSIARRNEGNLLGLSIEVPSEDEWRRTTSR